MDKDIEFMTRAIELAKHAGEIGEIPVGALIVDKGGKIISEAYNLRENSQNAIAHAEILAIRDACSALKSWRLGGCTLYVTLEPCPMCAGAIVNSRIDRVVWGADDMLAGCCKSVINLNSYPFNHSFSTIGGVCGEECKKLLTDFFKSKRKNNLKERHT